MRGARSPRPCKRGLAVSYVAERPRVIVIGASGYAGAIAAALLWRHPGFELAAITAREDAGRPLNELYPHHRVPLLLEQLDLDRVRDADAAVVELTKLTKSQAEYLGVPVEGPYKPEHYRY